MKKIQDLKVGDSFKLQKRVGWVEVLLFALLTGDWGWIHTRPKFARKAGFGGCIVHGLLVTGYIGKAVAKLVGHGAIVTQLKNLKFREVPIGTTVNCEVTVSDVDLRRSLVTLQCSCECTIGDKISKSRGEALVFVLDI
jgi:acyl dehydratase